MALMIVSLPLGKMRRLGKLGLGKLGRLGKLSELEATGRFPMWDFNVRFNVRISLRISLGRYIFQCEILTLNPTWKRYCSM